MLKRLEGFIFNKFAGKLIARAILNLAGFAVTWAGGNNITLNQAEVQLALTMAADGLYEWYKNKRNAPKAEIAK